MPILFFTEEIDFHLQNEKKIKDWLNEVLVSRNFRVGDLNYIFVSEEKILKLNKEYLSHDYYTDIITFNYNDENLISGDIFISVETVESNSIKFSTTLEHEMNRVIVHGALHLIGYNDKTNEEKQKMRSEEDICLSLIV